MCFEQPRADGLLRGPRSEREELMPGLADAPLSAVAQYSGGELSERPDSASSCDLEFANWGVCIEIFPARTQPETVGPIMPVKAMRLSTPRPVW